MTNEKSLNVIAFQKNLHKSLEHTTKPTDFLFKDIFLMWSGNLLLHLRLPAHLVLYRFLLLWHGWLVVNSESNYEFMKKCRYLGAHQPCLYVMCTGIRNRTRTRALMCNKLKGEHYSHTHTHTHTNFSTSSHSHSLICFILSTNNWFVCNFQRQKLRTQRHTYIVQRQYKIIHWMFKFKQTSAVLTTK